MKNKKENIPFSYERGKVKLTGQTDKDRGSVRLDILLYWSWKIIIAIGILISLIK